MIIFVADNNINSINKKRKTMKNTHLTPDQSGTLLDLVSDQVRAQRVYLRSTSFKHLEKFHISALTHLRNIKRKLQDDEMQRMRAEALQMIEAEESNILFQTFSR